MFSEGPVVIHVGGQLVQSYSHTLDATGKSETGQLLLAILWSPSFNNGTTSDFFQADGKTEVNKERLTITVRIGRIHGRASLSTDVDTLS